MIFSYVMLDIRSISFRKYKNIIEFLDGLKFLSKAICWFHCKTIYICNLLSLWALSNCCDPLRESFHTPMIKITYTSTHMLYFYTWKIASTSIHLSTNKTPSCTMTNSLQSYHHNLWAIQKEIKDAYPKKGMPHSQKAWKKRVPRKEKRCIPKEGMPHVHKTCRKKEKRKNI